MDDNKITYFGETDARNKRVKFGIKAKDRTRHVYVIGKTGMGKSTLLENMAVQDIQNGEGMCFIDPHGKTADLLMEYVPKERIRDIIYIAPFDTEFPISFNVLESIDPDKRHLVVSGLMSTFKKIWVDAWSARMEYILTNTLLALLEAPGTTFLGVNRMLSDKAYRNEIITYIQDPSVKAFWTKEFANYTERQAAEAVPAIQNKVGQFTANPLIRNMIGQPNSSFNFRDAMDRRKIMIINLSKGKIGDENMKLLGGLLVTKIYLAAMSRADVSDRVMKMMPNFYLFVDEFQNFANASFADILSEARKYKLNLTIAHQYVEQMDEFVRPAVFGNVGTMIVFRIGANDAEMLENEFTPQFTIEDLVNLGQYQMYLKLMINGLTSPPFSATNLPPFAHPDQTYMKEIIDASREQFARPRAEVEDIIVKFHEPTVAAKPAAKAAAAVPSKPAAAVAPAGLPKAPTATPKAVLAETLAAAPAVAPKQETHKPFGVLSDLLTKKAPTVSSVSAPRSQAIKPELKAPSSSTATALPASPAASQAQPAQAAPVAPTLPVVQSAPAPVATPSSAVSRSSSASISLSAPVSQAQPMKIASRSAPAAPSVKPAAPQAAASQAASNAPVVQKPAPSAGPASQAAPAPAQASRPSIVSQPSSKPIVATTSPESIEMKATPVSLSALAPKPAASRVDPKVPTPKNVNDLRSALAAALAKPPTASSAPAAVAVPAAQAQPVKAAQTASPAPIQMPASALPQSQSMKTAPMASPVSQSAPVSQAQPIKPSPAVPTPMPASQSLPPKPMPSYQANKPQEVPEDVLKNVLKLE